jgi:ABC-type spermidine/putrescine transport system permease subunit II
LIVAIIIAILAGHALEKAFRLARIVRSGNGLIPILELFVVFVLSFLVLHSYYEGTFKGETHGGFEDRPFSLVIALIAFCLASMIIYTQRPLVPTLHRSDRPKKPPRPPQNR